MESTAMVDNEDVVEGLNKHHMDLGKYKTLLFDLDNTLVNSSEIVLCAMKLWCETHHVDLEQTLRLGEGRRTEDTVKLVAPHLDAGAEAKQIEDIEARLVEDIKPIKGAPEFTDAIPKTKWAIVTSSLLSSVDPKLNAAKISIPEVIISAENVKNGKPDPEPYVMAMKMLGVMPDECLVFEDADSGVKSALGAGCKVVVIGKGVNVSHSNIICQVRDFTYLTVTTHGSVSVKMKIT